MDRQILTPAVIALNPVASAIPSEAAFLPSLAGVDLAWWPEFLLLQVQETSDVDSFTVSLGNLASALAEEDSLS